VHFKNPWVFFPYARTSIKVKERRAHTLGSLKKRKVSCKGRLSGPAVRMGGNGDGMMGWDAKKRQKISKWSIEINCAWMFNWKDVRWCQMMSLVMIYDQIFDRWIVVSVESSPLMQSAWSQSSQPATGIGKRQQAAQSIADVRWRKMCGYLWRWNIVEIMETS